MIIFIFNLLEFAIPCVCLNYFYKLCHVFLAGLLVVKNNATLSQCRSVEADLRTPSNLRWELFPTIENVVRFDATSDFLKRSCSFGLLFAEMGFGSIINMIKISNQIGDKLVTNW